jgi:hypothetical protein
VNKIDKEIDEMQWVIEGRCHFCGSNEWTHKPAFDPPTSRINAGLYFNMCRECDQLNQVEPFIFNK